MLPFNLKPRASEGTQLPDYTKDFLHHVFVVSMFIMRGILIRFCAEIIMAMGVVCHAGALRLHGPARNNDLGRSHPACVEGSTP